MYTVLALQNITELRSRIGNTSNTVAATILGLNYPVDESYMIYVWDESSVLADNSPETIVPTARIGINGRWLKIELEKFPQVNSDWNATSGITAILNKPTLFNGDYNSLINKPTIPTALQGIQRLRAQTDTSGNLTWTFTTPFGAGVVPIIGLTVEDSSTAMWNHQITAISNTAVSIRLTKTTAVTLLGISVLGVASAPQAFVHLTAVQP